MPDKTSWIADAMIEIFEVLYPEYSIHQDVLDKAITVILKHCPDKGAESEYRANFLWGFEEDSPESIGYEFCNARTERFREQQWKALREAICPHNKGVGGLLAAAKDMVAAAETDNPTAWQSAVINLEAALAEYEEMK